MRSWRVEVRSLGEMLAECMILLLSWLSAGFWVMIDSTCLVLLSCVFMASVRKLSVLSSLSLFLKSSAIFLQPIHTNTRPSTYFVNASFYPYIHPYHTVCHVIFSVIKFDISAQKLCLILASRDRTRFPQCTQ